MKTFKNSELKTFEQLAMLSQSSLKQVLASFLKKHYRKVVQTKEYVIAEGDIPVALVSHLDTVFKTPPVDIFFDPRKNVVWSPDGLGADDRAGVFAIVQIIRSGLRPHIIFTTDEEIGGIGATKLSTMPCPFKDLKYIIELDRRGSNDCVFYDCENPEFTEYVESFGFECNFGTYSDICEFCPTWGIAGVNLSIGYRDEHSVSEILFVGQMYSTIEKVKKMLNEAKELEKLFIYIPAPMRYSFSYGPDWLYGNSTNFEVERCVGCGIYCMEEEMFPVIMQDKTTKYYCPDCLVKECNWCDTCQNAYQMPIDGSRDIRKCPHCKEKEENDTK